MLNIQSIKTVSSLVVCSTVDDCDMCDVMCCDDNAQVTMNSVD